MDDEMNVHFSWIPMIKRGFLKSFSGDYEVGTLELLQQNIAEEIRKVKLKYDSKRGELLFQCIEYFYYHFCRKWYQWKKFSLYMEVAWVHILSSFLKIGLLLSQGKKKSKWINRVSTAIMRFPGEKNLMYDALLSINCLNKKYQPVYGSILMCLLIYASSFVPIIINDPAEYLKLCLLFRRLTFMIKDPAEKSELQLKASKILAPSTLLNWLSAHDFSLSWMKSGLRIDLRTNIFKKLGGKECEKEVVKTIRKILLPGIFTERKAELGNDTDRFITERNNIDNFDNMPLYVTDSFKKRNYVSMAQDDWVPAKGDKEITVNEPEVRNKKMKNRRNYISVRSGGQDSSARDNTEESVLNEMEMNSKKRKNYVSVTHYDPLLLEDVEKKTTVRDIETKSKKMKTKRNCVSSDGTKQIQMEISKKEQQSTFMCNNDDSVAESKSKKKKQRKEVLIITEKNPKIMHEMPDDHSLFKDISLTSEATKNRKKSCKEKKVKKMDSHSKEIELISVYYESHADSLPVIIDETNVSEPVPNENVCLSKFRNADSASSCSDDEPVIVTEIKHYSVIGPSSSQIKKSILIETDLNLNTETETKNVKENIFVIDSEPTNFITESDTVQITYDTIYDSEQRDVTSCEKPEKISDDKKDLNSFINLADLQEKLLSETNSRLKIADKSDTSEETQDSCTGKSGSLKNAQQDGQSQIICAWSVSNLADECLISERETNISLFKQSDINVSSQECKQEDGANVISSNIEKRSDHINQADEESSRDLTVQTKILNYSSNQASDFVENFRDIKSDLISKKLGGKSEKFPMQVDLIKETTQINAISQEIPALESCGSCMSEHSLNGDNCAQVTEVQKDDYVSFKTGILVSDTDKVDFPETNLVFTEMTENNSEVIVKSELSFEKNKMTQEKKVSESIVDSSLSNISFLKSAENSAQSVVQTVIYESVNSSERNNLESVQNIDSVELKSEAPMEHSLSSLLENKSFVQSMDYPSDTDVSSQEVEIRKGKLVTDSNLPNKNDSEVVSNSNSNDYFEVDNPKILKDNASIDISSPSRNDSIHELPKYRVTEPLFDVKSPTLKTGYSQRSVDHQILDENQNLGVEAKSGEVKTPNSSAANGLMEKMLKLVELASYTKDESVRQNILKGDLTSTAHGLSLEFLSCVTLPENEKSAKCLSFLNISTESVSSQSEIQGFTCPASKNPEFLEYRDISSDQDDIRSEGTLSENKSILKADASEYPSDASNDTEGEESISLSDCNSRASSSDGVPETSNFENNYDTNVVKSKISFTNAIERHPSKEDDSDESHTESQDIDISTIRMLNPVVNLGKRCDSKTFIFMDSSVSADSPLLPGFGAGDVEVNETKPFESNQAPSTINHSLNLINEITMKPEVMEDSPSKTHGSFTAKYEISEMKNDVKIQIHPGQKDVKELYLTLDQEITVSNKSQESVELISKREFSQDQEGIRCNKGKKVSVCKKDQESAELPRKKELLQYQENTKSDKNEELVENRKENFMLSRSMKLRKRPAPAIQTQKSSLADEDYSVINQNSPTTSVMSLRSRNPPASSSQEVRKSRSQTVTKKSSKRLKKKVNVNLGFDFSELSLNSPKTLRSKPDDSSNKSSSEVVKDNIEPSTNHEENSCRRLTRASVLSSNVDSKIKDQDTDPEGYNLRSRKPVIMPGRLKL